MMYEYFYFDKIFSKIYVLIVFIPVSLATMDMFSMELPEYVGRCNLNLSPDRLAYCVAKSINSTIPNWRYGDAFYGIPQLHPDYSYEEPIELRSFEGDIHLLPNSKFYNLEKLVSKNQGLADLEKKRIILVLYANKTSIAGKGSIAGIFCEQRYLNSTGKVTIEINDVTFLWYPRFSTEIKFDEDRLRILPTTRVRMIINGLFKISLQDNHNMVQCNSTAVEWLPTIWQSSLEDVYANIFNTFANILLTQIPAKKIFVAGDYNILDPTYLI